MRALREARPQGVGRHAAAPGGEVQLEGVGRREGGAAGVAGVGSAWGGHGWGERKFLIIY